MTIFGRPAVHRRLLAAMAVVVAIVLALAGPPLRAAAPIARHIRPNGLTVLIKENPTADLVAVDILVRGAPRVEEAEVAGVAFFVREMLFRGTTRRTAAEIAAGLESVGGTLNASTSFDYTELAAVVPAAAVDTALAVLGDLVTNAKFEPADIEVQRRVNLARLRQRADNPATRAFDLTVATLYGAHPYAKGLLGSVETISALTRERLLAFYRTFYAAPNVVVSVVGNLPAATALEKVGRVFGGMSREPVPHRVRLLPVVEGALAPRPSQALEVREPRQTTAAWINVGYLGVGAAHRDWAALRVLNAILGEGLSSRLFVEIREKRGLAYSVGSSFSTLTGPAPLILSAGTDPVNQAKVIDGLLRESTRLRETLPTPAEMDRARQRIVGVHAIDHEDFRRQAFLPAFYEILGVGYAFDARLPDVVTRVTVEDVQRVARLYMQYPTVAVVAPPTR